MNTRTKQSVTGKSFNGYENTFINYQDEHPQKILRKWREEHSEKYKARLKRNLTNSNSTILNGIISFSEQIRSDLGNKYSREEFEKSCQKAIERIAEQLETEVMYVAFHYDEKTPHVQFHFRNFDQEGKSIFHKNCKTAQLSVLQDIAFDELKSLGMERGQSKDVTNRTHQTTQAYYSKLYSEFQSTLRDEVKSLKEARKSLAALDLSIEEKRAQGASISQQQEAYRRTDKLLGKLKKEEPLTTDEAMELKNHLPSIWEMIGSHYKREILSAVEEATRKNNPNR